MLHERSELSMILDMRPRVFTRPHGVAMTLHYWASRETAGQMTAGTVARYERVFAAFERFAVAHGCGDLTTVDRQLCARFVYAPQRTGEPPAASSSRFRLTVLRDAYTALAGPDANPTNGLAVAQPPQARRVVPLFPAEAARLRTAGRISPRDHLRPAAVELALLGGSHAEIAGVVIADLDLIGDRVLLGSRWASVDAFGVATLSGRAAACRRAARRRGASWEPNRVAVALSRPLATYPATSIAPGISSSLSRALAKAGITRPGVRASSIREFAANRSYAMAGRVEEVAALLGLTSLDAAMGYVDLEWQRTYGDEVRG